VTNKLDAVLAAAHGHIQLMTHVVAGYPDLDTGLRLVRAMAACGVRIIEIQIPFTDPLADGPTIMAANQAALDAGMTPEDALAWAGAVAAALPEVAVLVMTYANVPYAMGMEEFLRRCAAKSIQGVIIPDLPVDEPEGDYAAMARRLGVHPVMVISPDTPEKRLELLLPQASGLLYTTLKVGITGASSDLHPEALAYLQSLGRRTHIPIAAGFGISQPRHVAALAERAQVAVVGSHVLGLLNHGGIPAVEAFLRACMA